MSESTMRPPPRQLAPPPTNKPTRWPFALVTTIFIVPVLAAVIIYQYESFDPAELPLPAGVQSLVAPRVDGHMLDGSERIGEGQLPGPEDIAYDRESGLIYTGCNDGWIRRVRLNDSAVEDWVYTGGRPLGIVLGRSGDVIVADTEKGLLRVSQSGEVEVLVDEAEGVKFRLTDGVDVAEDGTIYFTDASYKYRFHEFIWDVLEGRPYGRFMSFDPNTRLTKVLARDLYFANGVAVSPDQDSVVFCETIMCRCQRYYINGDKKGSVDMFVEGLPGVPDNIRYDGEGHYWIGLSTELTRSWLLAFKYPFIRKALGILEKYNKRPHMELNSGVFAVDLEGKPIAHYYEPGLVFLSSAVKIGNYLYCGNIAVSYITRLDLNLKTDAR